jgi:hypothetical protein
MQLTAAAAAGLMLDIEPHILAGQYAGRLGRSTCDLVLDNIDSR